jgi:ABC-type transport system involved in multi-copper enzyme maturation permease subunit
MSEALSGRLAAGAIPAPRNRWRQQLAAIVRLELRKTFPLRTLFALALLALAPVGVLGMRVMFFHHDQNAVGDATSAFARLFQDFSLRFIVCLGCAAVFGNLVHREQLDRTLHYYLLTPVRRELLTVGKYLAGLIVAVAVLGLSTVVSFFIAYAPFDDRAFSRFLVPGPGLGQLLAYVAVTVLACAAYGAVFLAFGTFVRNPVLPALAVLTWEGLHSVLPATLQHLSVVHYLLALCPIHLQTGLFMVLTDPPSAWLAVPVLILLAALGVGLAARRVRSVQIQYDHD